MRLADKMDSLYSSNGTYFGQNNMRMAGGPTPMRIGNIEYKKYNNTFQRNQLSYAERNRRIEQRLCFICGQKNCIARNHTGIQKGGAYRNPNRPRYGDGNPSFGKDGPKN